MQHQILQAFKADQCGQLVPAFSLNLKEPGLNSGCNWRFDEIIWKRQKICLKNLNKKAKLLNCGSDGNEAD